MEINEKLYYDIIEELSYLYARQIGLGRSYRQDFKNIEFIKIVRHGGCNVHYNIRGYGTGAIYRR